MIGPECPVHTHTTSLTVLSVLPMATYISSTFVVSVFLAARKNYWLNKYEERKGRDDPLLLRAQTTRIPYFKLITFKLTKYLFNS